MIFDVFHSFQCNTISAVQAIEYLEAALTNHRAPKSYAKKALLTMDFKDDDVNAVSDAKKMIKLMKDEFDFDAADIFEIPIRGAAKSLLELWDSISKVKLKPRNERISISHRGNLSRRPQKISQSMGPEEDEGGKRRTGPPQPPLPKRIKLNCMYLFALSQRYAQSPDLRHLFLVDTVEFLLHNGDTYEYLYYITALVLQVDEKDINILRTDDGKSVQDSSEEWKVMDIHRPLQGGYHLVEFIKGGPSPSF